MPTPERADNPGGKTREDEVPQPAPPKPAIREMEKKPATREPGPDQPPEAA